MNSQNTVKTISGWNSDERVKVHAIFSNTHEAIYDCKAKDLAYLCVLLDSDVSKDSLLHCYKVSYKGNFVLPSFSSLQANILIG